MKALPHLVLSCTLLLAAIRGLAAGNADLGQALYQERCTACHSAQYNGLGPAHQGVYGRRPGQAPGYAYSAALRSAEAAWTEETLDRWLADPEKYLPGQRMGVSVADPKERADLIAYLKKLSGK